MRFLPALLAGFVMGISAFLSGDFDNVKQHYEFVYHDSTDLMLIIHNDNCIFRAFGDEKEFFLNTIKTQSSHTTSRENVENMYIDVISKGDAGTLIPSTLQDMRDTYHDLLADFHCLDKKIFRLVLPSDNSTSTHTGSHGSHSNHGNHGNHHCDDDC